MPRSSSLDDILASFWLSCDLARLERYLHGTAAEVNAMKRAWMVGVFLVFVGVPPAWAQVKCASNGAWVSDAAMCPAGKVQKRVEDIPMVLREDSSKVSELTKSLQREHWAENVAACTREVQYTPEFVGTHVIVSRFEAYSHGFNQVKMVGTARERFHFQKCMEERGYDLQSLLP